MRTDMNRICMYTPSADGGHARYTWELLTALSRQPRGFRYELVTSEDFDPRFKSDLYPAHTILPVLQHRKSYRSKLTWATSRITHYIRRERKFLKWLEGRPDISGVHFQEWTPWLAASLFRRVRRMEKKIFYTVHNILPHKYPRFLPKAVMHNWVRRGCRSCDCLFVHTELLAGELSRFLNGNHPPIQVVPHGVWTVDDFQDGQAFEDRVAKKRLLFFGELRRNKGLHLLLQAAELLPDFSITIAGEPCDGSYFREQILPQVNRLREMGRQIDLKDRFIAETEVGPLFSTHSAIVLPYTGEFKAQSGVVFMALAHELPVVASEVGGLRDLLNQYKIGVTFQEQKPSALANAVRLLYAGRAKQDLLEQIRAAKDRFSWQEAARRTVDGYLNSPEHAIETDECAIETTVAN
jgi:glycosyltransferase involved in cell wall biosynthesis